MPRKQLTIKPKEVGSTIKFGKLPLFTSSLTHWADMDNVVQLKVEGRHYAIELRKSGLEKALDEMREQMGTYTTNYTIAKTETETPVEDKEDEDKTASFKEYPTKTNYQIGRDRFLKLKELADGGGLANCKNRLDLCEKLGFEPRNNSTGYNWLSNQIKKGYLEEKLVHYNKQNSGEYEYRLTGEEPAYSGNKNIKEKAVEKKWKKLTNELENLGFTSLPASPKSAPKSTPKNREEPLRPFARGDLELSQWLKPQDYLIYRLFVYGNGQVSVGKAVTFDDVRDVFLELPDVKAKKTRGTSQKTAGRIANVALMQLIKKGVLAKEQPEVVNKKNIFSLTLLKGGQYARKVYYTVSNGTYREGKGRTRELCDQPD